MRGGLGRGRLDDGHAAAEVGGAEADVGGLAEEGVLAAVEVGGVLGLRAFLGVLDLLEVAGRAGLGFSSVLPAAVPTGFWPVASNWRRSLSAFRAAIWRPWRRGLRRGPWRSALAFSAAALTAAAFACGERRAGLELARTNESWPGKAASSWRRSPPWG
jgi:hypothetical protein